MAEYSVWSLTAWCNSQLHWVSWSKLFNFSVPLFPLCTRRIIIVLTGLFWDSNEIMLSKCLHSAGCFIVSA